MKKVPKGTSELMSDQNPSVFRLQSVGIEEHVEVSAARSLYHRDEQPNFNNSYDTQWSSRSISKFSDDSPGHPAAAAES